MGEVETNDSDHSSGAIILYKNGKTNPEQWETVVVLGLKYLQKHQTTRFFSFPKGHIEHGETKLEAAYREIYEETGIEKSDLILLSEDFLTSVVPNKQNRNVYLYLMELKEKKSHWKPIDANVELMQFVSIQQIVNNEPISVHADGHRTTSAHHMKPEFVNILQENWNIISQY